LFVVSAQRQEPLKSIDSAGGIDTAVTHDSTLFYGGMEDSAIGP